MRDGLRVVDQFGQKADGGGNYKLEIEAQVGQAQVQKTDIMRVKHGETTTNIDMGYNQASVEMNVSADFDGDDTGDIFTFNFEFEDGTNHSVDVTITRTATTTTDFNLDLANAVAADGVLKDRITVQGVASGATTFDIQSLTKGAAGNFVLTVTRDVSGSTAAAGAGVLEVIGTNLTNAGGSETVDTSTSAHADVEIGTDIAQSGLADFSVTGLVQGTYKITTDVDAAARVQTANNSVNLVAQYRQSGTNDLITDIGLATAAGTGTSIATSSRTINAQMAFEVTAVDGDDVTLFIKSWEMDENGSRSYYEAERVVDKTLKDTANETMTVGNIEFNHFDLHSGNITVGDTCIVNIVPDGAATQDLVTITQTTDEVGDSVANSFTYYKAEDDWNNSTQTVDYLTLNTENGNIEHSEINLTFETMADYTDNDGTFVSFDRSAGVGELATEGTQLRDIEAFWDKSGNFLIDEPQQITIVQGDGQQAQITLFGTDTIDSVKEKFNAAIADQLGQAELSGIGATHSDKFVSFVTEGSKSDDGLESVAGTFVIRSAITGDAGELTFVGDENVIKALSLTNLTDAKENTFTINVTDAHTGDYVAKDVEIEGNMLVGTVHQNVDVEFDNMTGIEAEWDTSTKNFDLTGGFANKDETYVHIADNTMVFQIGANPLQDVGAAIGDMRARALGVNNILVTDREHASDSITKIDSAIQRVSSERSKMGALQNRLDHTINNLGVASENLTAAESRIRDLDFAKEMMSFTRSQIMLQAGTAMLAQANMKPQSVLQLLG
jgi:flagellin